MAEEHAPVISITNSPPWSACDTITLCAFFVKLAIVCTASPTASSCCDSMVTSSLLHGLPQWSQPPKSTESESIVENEWDWGLGHALELNDKQIHMWKVVWWNYNKIKVLNINFYWWLRALLCSTVAFLAVSKTELGGSNSWHGIPRTVRMLERVPSSWGLGHISILFLLTRLKTCFSPAFECSRVRTRIATCVSFACTLHLHTATA